MLLRNLFLYRMFVEAVKFNCPYNHPKVATPVGLNDYRPIACCTVLYKVITKVLATILSQILPPLISQCQSAFVLGRSIVDSVLLAHELVRNYHREAHVPSFALKIYLRKAYDLVN